ncbi:MAG: shikimate dehydrogenase [Bifidobacteriaceae bacterium]|jgi:shikimate dehydrogenase|nr:shikimate dehydrogenase [Bifidobacteriaceae bacterium]
MTSRAAVLGSPIDHSLSPALHRAAYAALGFEDWCYEAIEMTPGELGPWLATLGPEWKGLSLTMPLKRMVLGLVDHVQPLAKMTGGVNTVIFTPAGTVGANTDVYGMVAAVSEAAGVAGGPGLEGAADTGGQGARWPRSASVLGGGATAAAALAALAELGLRNPRVYVRSTARSRPMLEAAARIGAEPQLRKLHDDRWPADWPADLTISTLPPHAGDGLAASLHAAVVPAGAVLLDVAYDPWPSALAVAWEEAGGRVAGGKTMLAYQAAAQVRMMTGHTAPLDEMRAAIGLPSV